MHNTTPRDKSGHNLNALTEIVGGKGFSPVFYFIRKILNLLLLFPPNYTSPTAGDCALCEIGRRASNRWANYMQKTHIPLVVPPHTMQPRVKSSPFADFQWLWAANNTPAPVVKLEQMDSGL